MDRHPFRAFAFLSLFYGIAIAGLSYVKLLWLDELITLHIARLGSVTAIWHALAHAADPNPPLTHLAVLASMRLFGAHTYVYRLPAMLGYWLGMLALFLFLKRRVPATWALLGVVISMGMGGFEWSYESRSYALFYGTTMLALYFYSVYTGKSQRARQPRSALVGMTLALFLGLCANYFSILAFVPIIAGEVSRTWAKLNATGTLVDRRASFRFIDWPIWGAILVAASPLLIFHSFIQRSIALYQPYAWNKVSFDMTDIAYLDMVEAMLWPLGSLVLMCGIVWFLSSLCDICRGNLRPAWLGAFVTKARPKGMREDAPPVQEVTPVLVLLLYPYLGWALASLHGGMLSARFVIPVCFGFAISSVYLAYRTLGQHQVTGPVLLGCFLLWFMVRESYVGYSYNEEKTALFTTFAALREVDHFREPIVVSDNLLILPFQHYAPPDVASRVVYPIDMAAIMNRRHEASGEVNLWTGRDTYAFRIVPLAFLQHSVASYLLVTSEPDWLLDDLHAHHYDDDILPVDTHAEPLNYVATPLSHGKSEIFRVYADQDVVDFPAEPAPEPFRIAGELPLTR